MSTRSRAPKPTAELPIGKLAKQLGISTATIHFYVSEGILPPPRRINRTRAAYGPRHARILRLVRRLQATGLSLAYIKGLFHRVGTEDAALTKLEGVGYFQPLRRPRNDPQREPIEPFDPVDRDAFLAMAHAAPGVVDALERWGLLRPKQPGRYDARDLWVLRNVQSLLDDGVRLEDLALQEHALPLVKAVSPILMHLVSRHEAALRSRQLRFTDLLEPFASLIGYLSDRVNDELHPAWRTALLESVGPSPS